MFVRWAIADTWTHDDAGRLPGLGGHGHPPLRRPGGAGHALPRGPHEVGAQPRPGGLAACRSTGRSTRTAVAPMPASTAWLPTRRCCWPTAARGRSPTCASVTDLRHASREGRYRRYVETEVLAHWSTVKPAYRVTLEDGTELVASGDHRFLSRRGWKHVTGSRAAAGAPSAPDAQRRARRASASFAAAPVEDADYRRGYLCGMVRGDGNVGTYAYDVGTTSGDVASLPSRAGRTSRRCGALATTSRRSGSRPTSSPSRALGLRRCARSERSADRRSIAIRELIALAV